MWFAMVRAQLLVQLSATTLQLRQRLLLLLLSLGWARRGVALQAYSGMLPCLRRGNSSRFDFNMSNPAISLMRVSAGSMTSST
jgi:hypothetical protein